MPPKSKKIMSALKLGKHCFIWHFSGYCALKVGLEKSKKSKYGGHAHAGTYKEWPLLCKRPVPLWRVGWFYDGVLTQWQFPSVWLADSSDRVEPAFFFLPPSPFPLWVETTVTSFQNTHQNRWCTGWRQGLSFIRL